MIIDPGGGSVPKSALVTRLKPRLPKPSSRSPKPPSIDYRQAAPPTVDAPHLRRHPKRRLAIDETDVAHVRLAGSFGTARTHWSRWRCASPFRPAVRACL